MISIVCLQPLWRSVSAQYLDQIVSNRDIDYNAEEQTNSGGSLNEGDVGAADDVMSRRQASGSWAAGGGVGHRPVIKQSSTTPVHNQHLRQRSGSHGKKDISHIPSISLKGEKC